MASVQTSTAASTIMRQMIGGDVIESQNSAVNMAVISEEEYDLFPDLIDIVDGDGMATDVSALVSSKPVSVTQNHVSTYSSGNKADESHAMHPASGKKLPVQKREKDTVNGTPPTVIKLKMSSNQEDQFLKYITTFSSSDIAMEPVIAKCSGEIDGIGTRKSPQSLSPISLENETGTENSMLSMSKHAIAARENRQKKKAYVTGLQSSVKSLTVENCNLKKDVTKMQECVNKLKSEVDYLKSVIANQSSLAALLKNTLKTPGVQFVASGLVSNVEKPPKGKSLIEKQGFYSTRSSRMLSRRMPVNKRKYEYSSDSDSDSDASAQVGTSSSGQKYAKADHPYATGKKGLHLLGSQSSKSQSSCKGREKENLKAHASTGSHGGICMHVSGKMVSLEFCTQCNDRASKNTHIHDGEDQVKV